MDVFEGFRKTKLLAAQKSFRISKMLWRSLSGEITSNGAVIFL